MPMLYLATGDGPIIVTRRGDRWRAERPLDVHSASCIAADPRRPQRVFCTTARDGVWRSDDAGASWHRVFQGVGEGPRDRVTAVAVSAVEWVGGLGVVYVGTEPSTVARSEDAGETWHECVGLTDLSSASEWRFPPRPETHHVRWIEPTWPARPTGTTSGQSRGSLGKTARPRKPSVLRGLRSLALSKWSVLLDTTSGL